MIPLPRLIGLLVLSVFLPTVSDSSPIAETQRGVARRRTAPIRRVPRDYHVLTRRYYFPVVDATYGCYYHPYFGFYCGPYYGPFYPFPGPYYGHQRFTKSAVRTQVEPDEAEIYVNGYYAGVADDFDGLFQRLYLPAGEHDIELRLENYRPFRRQVYLNAGDTFKIEHRMERLPTGEASGSPPDPQPIPEEWTEGASRGESPSPSETRSVSPFGILAISAQPSDAAVFIDGDRWALANGLHDLRVHLSTGWHRLEIRRDGYQPFVTEIELLEGETTRLNIKLTETVGELPGELR